MHSQPVSTKSAAESVQQAETNYPSVRYFQIHFEFLQEQFQQTLGMLESLQARIQRLEQQLAKSKAKQDIYASPLQHMVMHKDDARLPLDWEKARRR